MGGWIRADRGRVDQIERGKRIETKLGRWIREIGANRIEQNRENGSKQCAANGSGQIGESRESRSKGVDLYD